MKDKIQSVVYKQRSGMDALTYALPALVRGTHSGVKPKGLTFLTDQELNEATAFNAAQGYFPEHYRGVVAPLKLDPTSILFQERSLAEKDKPSASVTPASLHAEEALSAALSSDFGEWWVKYSLLAERALQADAALKDSKQSKVNSNRPTHEYEGDIAAFVMATGNLIGGHIGMSKTDAVDVTKLVKTVLLVVNSVIEHLDHLQFSEGVKYAKDKIGRVVEPGSGQALSLIDAETFDCLMAAPFKRAMRNHHARELLRGPLTSRLVREAGSAFTISEGEDLVIIDENATQGGLLHGTALFDEIARLMDALNDTPLMTTDYEADFNLWSHQFRTTGDLIRALFIDQTVDPLAESYLCVFPTYINGVESLNGVDVPAFATTKIPGTGGLGSIDRIFNDRVNTITGTIPYHVDHQGDVHMGSANLDVGSNLPNRSLRLTSPGSVSLLDWVDLMAYWGRQQTTNFKTIMADRFKRNLKLESTTLSGGFAQVARILYTSQRDGVTSKAFGSFNLSKWSRAGQQGPVFTDLSSAVGPSLVTAANEWTRPETAGISRVVDVEGTTIAKMPSKVFCSSMVGEPQGGKAPSPMVFEGIPSSGQLGLDPDLAVAVNMHSMPRNLEGTQLLEQITDHTGNLILGKFGSLNPRFDHQAKHPVRHNVHPTSGFMRGYTLLTGEASSHSASSTMVGSTEGYAREATGVGPSITYNRFGKSTTASINTIRLFGTGTSSHIDNDAWEIIEFGDITQNNLVPMACYFADPGRTLAFGGTNHLLYGALFVDCNLNPAQTGPVVVPSGSVRLEDMQSDDPSHKSTLFGGVRLMGTGAASAIAGKPSISVSKIPDVALLDSRIEQDENCYPGISLTHGWFDRSDVVSELHAAVHAGEIGLASPVNNYVYGTRSSTVGFTDMGDLSIVRMLYGTKNQCSRNPVAKVAGFAIQCTDGVFTAATQFAIDPLNAEPKFFDGPNPVPSNADLNNVTVMGSGLCHEYDDGAMFGSVLDEIMRRVADAQPSRWSQLYPGASGADPMESPIFGARSGLAGVAGLLVPNVATWNGVATRIGMLTPTLRTTAEWFIQNTFGVPVGVPPEWVELMRDPARASALPHMWIRDGAKPGYDVQPFDIATATNIASKRLPDKLRTTGAEMGKGFERAKILSILSQRV